MVLGVNPILSFTDLACQPVIQSVRSSVLCHRHVRRFDKSPDHFSDVENSLRGAEFLSDVVLLFTDREREKEFVQENGMNTNVNEFTRTSNSPTTFPFEMHFP